MPEHGTKPSRRRTFQPEILEDRNLLSTLTPSAKPNAAEVRSAAATVSQSGNFGGIVNVNVNMATGQGSVAYNGYGLVSDLGLARVQGSHSLYFDQTGTEHIYNGRVSFTGSQGDRLTLDYVGTGTPNGDLGFNDTYTYTVDTALSTGKYAGATGGGTIHVTDLHPFKPYALYPFLGNFAGTISTVDTHNASFGHKTN